MEIRVVFMLLQKGTGKPKNIKISRIYAPIKNPVSPDAFFGGRKLIWTPKLGPVVKR
jgi:hypothetical protein